MRLYFTCITKKNKQTCNVPFFSNNIETRVTACQRSDFINYLENCYYQFDRLSNFQVHWFWLCHSERLFCLVWFTQEDAKSQSHDDDDQLIMYFLHGCIYSFDQTAQLDLLNLNLKYPFNSVFYHIPGANHMFKVNIRNNRTSCEICWKLKSGSHLPKKNFFIGFNDSSSKMMKNAFYFLLKALFFLNIFKVLSWLFGHVEKMAWLER